MHSSTRWSTSESGGRAPTSPEQAGSSPDKCGGGRGQEAEGEQQEARGLHGSGGPARAKLYDKGRALIAGMTPQSRKVS